jgi:hypothetical protein
MRSNPVLQVPIYVNSIFSSILATSMCHYLRRVNKESSNENGRIKLTNFMSLAGLCCLRNYFQRICDFSLIGLKWLYRMFINVAPQITWELQDVKLNQNYPGVEMLLWEGTEDKSSRAHYTARLVQAVWCTKLLNVWLELQESMPLFLLVRGTCDFSTDICLRFGWCFVAHMTSDVVFAWWWYNIFQCGCTGVVRQALSWTLDWSWSRDSSVVATTFTGH